MDIERDFEITYHRGDLTPRPRQVGETRVGNFQFEWTAEDIELSMKLWFYWWAITGEQTEMYPWSFVVAVVRSCDFWKKRRAIQNRDPVKA